MSIATMSSPRLSAFALALLATAAVSVQPARALPEHNVPAIANAATDLGAADPAHEMKLTVVLKLHDEGRLDAAIEALYDPRSRTYRQWMTATDLRPYAPTAQELKTVRDELVRQGYQILSVDPQRISIRVRGTVAITERAFQTTLHSYKLADKTFVAHTSDAQLTGAAGELVASVAGLDQHRIHPMFSIAKDPKTGKPRFKHEVGSAEAANITTKITDLALGAPITITVSDPSNPPAGTYTGQQYDPSGLVVAFTPQQLQSYYGMPTLYELGYTGKTQKIALIEGYGYDAAMTDANTFATTFHLPLFTAKNLRTVYPEGKPSDPNAGALLGWPEEIALDISSAHTIAPGADIVVVASSGQDNEDQIASIQYVINSGIARSISSSWENDTDIIAGAAEQEAFNTVLKLGAAQGFAFNFSSGDSGDNGLGTPVGAPGVPSNSPYATAVGGTSILNDPSSPAFYPTGWGNDLAYVDLFGTVAPGAASFFAYGAGGGQSVFFPKPSWQKALPGTHRLVPDVSAVADPDTGVVIFVTEGKKQYVIAGIGGTSLACPVFSAIWAIADEYAGHALGQAAPTISRLVGGEITDVTPATPLSANNVTGSYTDASGVTMSLDAVQVFGKAALEGQMKFTSALYNDVPGEVAFALSFGTNSSLRITKGWDETTGYGEPNGLPFVVAVSK